MLLQKTSKLTLPNSSKAQSLRDNGAKESSKDASVKASSLKPSARPLSEDDRSPSSNDGEEEEIVSVGEEFCTSLLLLIKVSL